MAARAGPALLVFAAIVAASAPGARAQQASRATLEGPARKHYVLGAGFLEGWRYDEAAAEFRKGYAIDHDPLFIYLEAQAYWHKKDDAMALKLLKRYRQEAPNAVNAYEVDQRIRTLEGGRHTESVKSELPPEVARDANRQSLDAIASQFSETAEPPPKARVAPGTPASPSAEASLSDPEGLFKPLPPPPAPPAPAPAVVDKPAPAPDARAPARMRWWVWLCAALAAAGGAATGIALGSR